MLDEVNERVKGRRTEEPCRVEEKEMRGRERASSRESNEQVARFPANDTTDTTDHCGKRNGNWKERGRHERQGEQICMCATYIYVERERERERERKRVEREGRWKERSFPKHPSSLSLPVSSLDRSASFGPPGGLLPSSLFLSPLLPSLPAPSICLICKLNYNSKTEFASLP